MTTARPLDALVDQHALKARQMRDYLSQDHDILGADNAAFMDMLLEMQTVDVATELSLKTHNHLPQQILKDMP